VPENPLIEKDAKLVWKFATRILPKVYGEDGLKALHLLKMLAYLEDHRIPIELIKEKNEMFSAIIEKILTKDGFITTNIYEKYDEVKGDIYLHSKILKRAIRDANDAAKETKMLLRECLKIFRLERFHSHYYSIWTLALDYNDLFKEFHHPGNFHGKYYYHASKYVELFEREITKYRIVYGELDEQTIKVY
jgi:hypothetical protein